MRQISEDANVACHLQYFCFISLSALGTIQFSFSFIMAGNLIIATETFRNVAEQAIIDWVEELNLENVNNEAIVGKLVGKWQRFQKKEATFIFKSGQESITLNGNTITVVHPRIIGETVYPPLGQMMNSGISIENALPNVMRQETHIDEEFIVPLCDAAMQKWVEIVTGGIIRTQVEMVHHVNDQKFRVWHTNENNLTVQPALEVSYMQ
jgi:hypothetical protein